MKRTLIGIDCGANTGFAIRYSNGGYELLTLEFWDAINKLRALWQYHLKEQEAAPGTVAFKVYIEDPNENKPIFKKKGADGYRQYLKIAQDVGMNKRDAQLFIAFCERNKIPYQTEKPETQKWTAAGLKHFTGITGRHSQHARDAVKLIVGR